MNETHLSKLASRILVEPASLLSQVIRCRYYIARKSANMDKNLSAGKKGIRNLNGNIFWVLGAGDNIKLGIDPWVPNVPEWTPRLNPRFQSSREIPMSSLLNRRNGRWNSNKLKQMFHLSDAYEILRLRLLLNQSRNKIFWIPAPNGELSVKSASKVLSWQRMMNKINRCGKNGGNCLFHLFSPFV